MHKRWWIAVGSYALVCLPALNLGCSGGGVMEGDEAASAIAAATRSDASRKKGPKVTPQQSNTTNGLIGISPVSKKVVWASGRNGTFVRTTDGGKSWTPGVVAGAETLQFRDVQGVSDKVAYLLSIGNGTDSRIYKTTDGGKSWTLQFQNQDPNAFYDCFAFWGPNQGVTMADSVNGRFPVVRTLDGTTWQDIGDRLPAALPGEAGFAASGTCAATRGTRQAWLATGGTNTVARILFTRDRGQTWAAADTPITVGDQSAGGNFSVAFRDHRHGFVAGGDLAAEGVVDNFARSHDGGRSWELATSAPDPGGHLRGGVRHRQGGWRGRRPRLGSSPPRPAGGERGGHRSGRHGVERRRGRQLDDPRGAVELLGGRLRRREDGLAGGRRWGDLQDRVLGPAPQGRGPDPRACAL